MIKFLFLFLLLPTLSFAAPESQNEIRTFSQVRAENLNSRDYQATNNNDEYTNSASRVNFISKIVLNKKWFTEINFRHEKVKLQNEDDRNYGGEGAYLREFRVGYEGKNFIFYGGKFRPFFGIAWRNGRNNWTDYSANNYEQFDYNNTRGIWTDYIAQGYAQTEKLGITSVAKAGNAKTVGKYELGLSLFTNDRKNFDNSIASSRSSASKSDGLPGDTRSLASYVASLDVSFDFAQDEKLFYRFAYINLATNGLASSVTPEHIADQKGFSAAINYQYPFSRNFNLNGLAEYVSMKNVGGNSDVNDNYFSSSVVANIYQNWNITTAYSSRENSWIGQNGFNQNMSEISGGYRFDKNIIFDSLLIQAAYRNLRSDYRSSLDTKNSVGVLLRLIKNF